MAKSRQLEALMAELNQLQEPASEAGTAVLTRIIGSKQGMAVAQAARIVGKAEIRALLPALETAFDYFMVKATTRDPGCRAKAAIAEVLYRLDRPSEAVFLAGIRHVQWEPIWGGQVDTAPKLRGICALGLVRMNYVGVMVELADLLADSELEARVGAARAIAYSENPLGVALLRLRIKLGDTPTAIGEYVAALLQLAALDSLPLMVSLLEAAKGTSASPTAVEIAEVVALALGESRLPEALEILQTWWSQIRQQELRQTGLLAIALLRRDDALQYLLHLAAEGALRDAAAAIEALRLYQNDDFVWSQVKQILAQRPDLASP